MDDRKRPRDEDDKEDENEDENKSKIQKTDSESPPRIGINSDLNELISPPKIVRNTDLNVLNREDEDIINKLKERLEVLQTEKTILMVKLDLCRKDKSGEISKLESQIVELDSLINPLDDEIFAKELEKSDGRKRRSKSKRRSKTKRRSKAKRSLYGC